MAPACIYMYACTQALASFIHHPRYYSQPPLVSTSADEFLLTSLPFCRLGCLHAHCSVPIVAIVAITSSVHPYIRPSAHPSIVYEYCTFPCIQPVHRHGDSKLPSPHVFYPILRTIAAPTRCHLLYPASPRPRSNLEQQTDKRQWI